MKGVSIAIETIVYLILAITVLSVLLFFFLTQAGPAQDQYKLEAERNRWCGSYVTKDLLCSGQNNGPHPGVSVEVVRKIKEACTELSRRFGYAYTECIGGDNLRCIQQCCLTCSQRA